MAHPLHVKARAMALLASGESASRVAEVLGVPRRTVRRWQDETEQTSRAVTAGNESIFAGAL